MLRVFISSTAEDLKPWRAAARDVVLDLGWHPVLLNEHGSADARPTVAMCCEQLAACELVVLLLAFRRGWVPDAVAGGDGNRSITALELDHARSCGLPVLAFMARESWPGNLWEPTDDGRAWMRDFRARLNQAAGFFEPEAAPLDGFRAALKSALATHKLALVEARGAVPKPPLPVFTLPYARNPHFTGRNDILDTLRARLCDPAAALRTVALTGLGGIGKTQTALEYAYRHAGDYAVVAWLRAEDPDVLAADYAALADALVLDAARAAERPARIKAVRDWLDRHERWLLVFDNAPGASALSDYRPRGSNGHVIVTSRDASWAGMAVTRPLEPLPVDAAAAFLLARLGGDDLASAREIARRLDGLPLALEQACAFAERSGKTLAQYLDLLARKQVELLRRGEVLDYPATVASTWELAFQELENRQPVAAALLQLLAWLAPDRIARSMFTNLAAALPEVLRSAIADELEFDDALAALQRASLVRVEAESLSLHRLVQVITRARMGTETAREWSAAALRFIESGFDALQMFDVDLLSHVRPAVDGTPGAVGEPLCAAGLLMRLAQQQRSQDEPALAEQALRDALALLAAAAPQAEKAAAALHRELADVLCEGGDFDAAVPHHFQAGMAELESSDVAADTIPSLLSVYMTERHVQLAAANAGWVDNELRTQGRAAPDIGEAEIEVALEAELHRALAMPDGGTLALELRRMRWRVWQRFGVALPPIVLNQADLPPHTALVHVDRLPIAGMRAPADARFVHEQREALDAAGLPYTPVLNPLNGQRGAWVINVDTAALEAAGIASNSPASVIALQAQAVIESRLGEFLSHQDVAELLGIHLPPAAAKQAIAEHLTTLTQVIRALLVERVPVLAVAEIAAVVQKGLAQQESRVAMVEQIRQLEAIRWVLPGMTWNMKWWQLTLATEATLARRLHLLNGEPVLAIEPELTQELLAAIRLAVQALPPDAALGALMVRNAALRPHMRRIVELEFPYLPVVAEREVPEFLRDRLLGMLEDVSRGDE